MVSGRRPSRRVRASRIAGRIQVGAATGVRRDERAGGLINAGKETRHSYATAALKAGIPPKIISERLGHSTAAFTMQTYTHVIPGMDEAAASAVAELILGEGAGHKSGHNGMDEIDQESKEPADLLRFRRSAGPSSSSGGGI